MKIFKRIIAYLIDIVLVISISTLISNNSYINKDYNKYKETYKEYEEKYTAYEDFISDIEKKYKDETLNEKEIKELVNTYPSYKKYFSDIKEIDKDNYDEFIGKINDDFKDTQEDYSYKLSKYSIIPGIIRIMSFLLYFVVIQFYVGNTLGKKIMKLKVVPNGNKKLNILNYFVRSLIVNEVFVNILNIIFMLILSKNNFIIYSNIMYVITYAIEVSIIFMMAFTKDNRGLHDYAAQTRVVEIKGEKDNEV